MIRNTCFDGIRNGIWSHCSNRVVQGSIGTGAIGAALGEEAAMLGVPELDGRRGRCMAIKLTLRSSLGRGVDQEGLVCRG